MRKAMSNQMAGIALLIMGIAIGMGLVFVTTHLNGGPTTTRTVTVATTATHILIITQTVSAVQTVSYAPVSATVVTCQWNGAQEYCEMILSNAGNTNTATTGECSLTYGGQTFSGYTGPTIASAVSPGTPQQLVSGGSPTVYCQALGGGAAGPDVQVTESVLLANGADVMFYGTSSS
jgi:hypothetical protein